MYHGDSSPQDQAADAAMKALYQQLDDHDLDADTPFNTAAGHCDLTHRIQAELSRVPQSAHVSREHERLLVSAHGTAGHHIGNLTDPASRGRLDREFSLNEEAFDDSVKDEIVDGEIANDPRGSEPIPLAPEDTILTPCHSGCTCGLHQQVVYGERVPAHPPSDLDHGEMALLTRAADDAAHLLNDFRDHLRKLRSAATRTYGEACRALFKLTLLLGSDAAVRARAQRNQVEAAYAAATDALTAHEIAWRDLRSARDEVISVVQAELARPWQTVILPARLRHGKAGPQPVEPKCEVKIEIPTATAVSDDYAGADQVKITYQLFGGVPQPQPSPGSLAEVVRTILELSPEPLRARQRYLEQSLLAQLGASASPSADPRPDMMAAARVEPERRQPESVMMGGGMPHIEDDMDTAARVLSLAQQTADQAIADARREADETRDRARREADKVLTKARRQAEQITGEDLRAVERA